jgi:hypothetical protein
MLRNIKRALKYLLSFRIVNLSNFSYGRRRLRMHSLQTFQKKTGFSIVPVSYFEPIPDLRQTNLADQSLDRLLSLDFELDIAFLVDSFFEAKRSAIDLRGLVSNHMFRENDGAAYFGIIKKYKPRRIVEIGSGHSALLASGIIDALHLDTHLLSIEPFPIPELVALAQRQKLDLLESPVQLIPGHILQNFSALEAGDILFIDTSHVAIRGGDTNFIFCHILPRLQTGVVVHFHDIYLPYDYDKGLYYATGRFYAEQYLLAAMLANTDRYIPLISVYNCTMNDSEQLLPFNNGSSFWFRRK